MVRKTALVVDDFAVVRNTIRGIIEPKGIDVIEAENGRKGLELLKEMPQLPDMIFVDLNMPEMDGLEFCEHLYGEIKVPIIMVTTEIKEELKSKAKLYGVKCWVMKPITPDRIMKAVELVVRG